MQPVEVKERGGQLRPRARPHRSGGLVQRGQGIRQTPPCNMAWMRLDLEETRSIEVEALDLTALGLFWWLVDRTWEQGGVPDDPSLIRRALRGRIDGAAFDDAWRQVRPLMDAGSDNRIRIAWVERAREDTIGHLKTDAARKKAERLRAKAVRPPDVRVTPPDVRPCPAESPDRTDGRTGQDRTDEPQKRAPRARPAPVDPWTEAVHELVPAPDRPGWLDACTEHAAARRAHGHKALTRAAWGLRVREWLPRGLPAFAGAVRQSAAQGWQGLFPEKGAAGAPPGTIQRGPNKGQQSARAILLGDEARPDLFQRPVRDTTATVLDP